MLTNKNLLTLIFLQSLVAMLGSLYFENYGDPLKGLFSGPGFEPCHMCWWARILMYPIVWFSLVALIRKDYNIVYTILPLSLVGIILTGYHYAIQHQAAANVFSCNPANPCTTIDWQVWGFLTIPLLAFIAFCVIFVCSILLFKNLRKTFSKKN